jgi:hypothetical protein
MGDGTQARRDVRPVVWFVILQAESGHALCIRPRPVQLVELREMQLGLIGAILERSRRLAYISTGRRLAELEEVTLE